MDMMYYGLEGLTVALQRENSYVNATALARRYYEQTNQRKDPNAWLRNKRTQETIVYVSQQTRIPPQKLVFIVQGGNEVDAQGTFLHPDLAIPFASWLSVEFEYKVTKIIQKYLVEQSVPEYRNAANRLRELINVLEVYFQDMEGYGEIIHTNVHRQVGKARSAVDLIKQFLDENKL